MNKETRAIITGMLGGLLISITVSGRFTSYVKPGFRPVLLAGGAILVLLAVISLVLTVREETRQARVASGANEPADGGDPNGTAAPAVVSDPHAGHQHSSRAPWLMLAPVLVLLFVAPPALGADAASRGISCGTPAPEGTTYPSRRTDPSPPLPAGNPVTLTMQDFVARSLYDSAYSTVHTDIQITAFIVKSACDADGYSLARLKISCCAADAFTLRVHVDDPAPYPANTWVTATVRAVKDTGDQADNYVPTVTVIGLTVIDQPPEPYET